MRIGVTEVNAELVTDIGGLVVTVILAIFAYLRSAQDLKRHNTLMISYLGVVFTLLVSIRYALIPEIKSEPQTAASLAVELTKRPEVFRDIIVGAARGSDFADRLQSQLIKDWFSRRLEQIKNEVNQFSRGHFPVTPDQMKTFALIMINSASKSVLATSKVSKDQWWEKPFGQRYQQANILRANEINITRIFVFQSADDYKESLHILKTQYEGGVHVKYCIMSKSEWDRLTYDRVIVDDRVAGRLELGQDSLGETSFTTDDEEVTQATALVKNLEAEAMSFSENTPAQGGAEKCQSIQLDGIT